MTIDSEKLVRDALLARGLDLKGTELRKVSAHFQRLQALYETLQAWTPPGTKEQER